MKRYIITACAVAMALTAMADVDLGQRNVELTKEFKLYKEAQATPATAPYAKWNDEAEIAAKREARRAPEAIDLAGMWTFQLGSYWAEPVGIFNVPYIATVEDNVVWFDPMAESFYPMATVYEKSRSALMYIRTYIGKITTQDLTELYIYQEPFVFNYDTEEADFQNVAASYNESTRSLTFTPNSGLAWVAYSNENGAESSYMGYVSIMAFEGAKMGSNENDNKWVEAGNALFMDGWMMPGFRIDQTLPENQYLVPLEMNLGNENRFRLVDPYFYGPLAEYNQSPTGGYIVFDVSNPDHVLFEMADAGFAYDAAGISTFYCYNNLGYWYNMFGGMFSAEEMISFAGEPYTTYKDGVVTLSSVERETTSGSTRLLYDANFGTQANPAGDLRWLENDNTTFRNMNAAITLYVDLSGVTEIDTDETAEPVYYNLSGIKVSNPEKGQLLIMRQGSKARKIIF